MGACRLRKCTLDGEFLEWESAPFFMLLSGTGDFTICCDITAKLLPEKLLYHTKTKQIPQYQQSQFPNSITWISQPCTHPSIDHLSNEPVIPVPRISPPCRSRFLPIHTLPVKSCQTAPSSPSGTGKHSRTCVNNSSICSIVNRSSCSSINTCNAANEVGLEFNTINFSTLVSLKSLIASRKQVIDSSVW